MGGDASEVLGAPEVAGTFVSPKGLTRRMASRAAGGLVGEAIGALASRRSGDKHEGAPDFGNVAYVAVTADEVAIVQGKTGLVKPKVGSEAISRMPRSDIASTELDKGALKGALKIEFADGGWWEFEIPRVYKKTAEQVVKALGGSIT